MLRLSRKAALALPTFRTRPAGRVRWSSDVQSEGPYSLDPSDRQYAVRSLSPEEAQARNEERHLAYMKDELKTLEDDPLPPLQRPPGIAHPPWLDPEKSPRGLFGTAAANEAERAHLQKMLAKGSLADLNALSRKHGGKTWYAPPVLIREDRAQYFPSVSGVALASRERASVVDLCRGKVSLVAIMSTNLSNEHCQSHAKFSLEAHGSNPAFRYVQINLQENRMKYYVLSLFISRLREKVPPIHQENYLLTSQSFEYLRDPLLMENKYVGYVYLLDTEMRIRWAAGGFASRAERDSLRRCAGVLLDRANEVHGVEDHAGIGSLDRWETPKDVVKQQQHLDRRHAELDKLR